MKRSPLRFVEIGDHVTPLKRYFQVIADDPVGHELGGNIQGRLVVFLQQVLAEPSLLAVGPVAAPRYSISHDGEKWVLRGEGESAQ